MNIGIAYLHYLDLVNRNATNNNLNVDKARFVQDFNLEQLRYLDWILNKKNEDAIRTIAPLLEVNKALELEASHNNLCEYSLPKNYRDLASLHVEATDGKCKSARFLTFEAKTENVEELLFDIHNKPSFKYRETFYITSNKKVKIYKEDFEFTKVLLSYYRLPNLVDIEGYINPISQLPSTDIDPEFDDATVVKILTAMAKQFASSNGDTQGYQTNKDTLYSEI